MTDSKERLYYPGLDALRGIAIILVLLYHYFPFFRIGWIGVDLFFVLSGFLITSILLRTRNAPHYFRNFFIRRSLRIFPLYFLALAVFYLALPHIFSEKYAGSVHAYYSQHQVWFWTFLQNWLFIKNGPPPEPYLVHFWSLAVEEQFYLLWPLLLFFVRKRKHMQWLLAIIFATALILRFLFWYLPVRGHEINYYHSLTRIDSLAAGSLLAVFTFHGRELPRKFILATVLLFVSFNLLVFVLTGNVEHYNIAFGTAGYSVSALFFMSLCFLALHEKFPLSSWTVFKSLGRISYGLYIFHLPVYLVTAALLNKSSELQGLAGDRLQWTIPFISLLFTFILSLLSYRYFELPLLRLRNKFH